jgi:signal transduction histidine kinase
VSLFLFLILFLAISCYKNNTSDYLFIQSQKYTQLNSAQKEKYLDSLESISKSLPNDTITHRLLFDLAGEYYYLNRLQKSLKVSKKVFHLTSELKDSMSIAKSLYYIGDCYEITQKDSAYFYYQKAEKLYRLLGNNERIGRMLFNKAYLLFYDGNYLESEILVSKALQLLKKSDYNKLKFTCYNLLASNLKKLEEYENSLKYYLLAKKLLNDLTKSNNDFDQKNNYKITIAVNIANIFEKQFQFRKAKYELESILSSELKKHWPNDYGTVIGNLGYIKTKTGNLKEGHALMKEALYLSRKSGIASSIVYKLHNLGKYYFDIKNTTQSIRYLKESLQLAEEIKSIDDVKVNLQLLSKIDKANTTYYDQRYITISDSLTKVQRKNRNKYARIEYETALVEDANKELSSRNLYLIVGVVILAGALGIRYVMGQRKEIVFRTRLQAAEQELFDLMQTSQIELNGAREEEQNRISRELHDNVMNKLYGTRLHLGLLNASTTAEAQEKRSEHIDELQSIENEIRSISHDLHTDSVASHFDYPVLLASCVQKADVNGSNLFSFESAPDIDWDAVSGLIKITIYRIVLEALFNVIKYADATECFIVISKPETTSLLLTISDNGKGFDTTISKTGIGLANMKERARLIKAELLIQSTIGQGTKIECHFEI